MISVILAVFNGEKYVSQAIESILSQTYRDLELIMICDGSTDSTMEILDHYQKKDPRVILLQNDKNMGVAYSRNKGIAVARGKYIAVMDSDDVSVSDRLEIEKTYLDLHPELGAVASNYQKMTSDGILTKFQTSYSLLPGINRWRLYFANQHCHPSSMMRRSLFSEKGIRYDESIRYAVDYDLWFQINEVSKINNLPNVLHYLRSHDNKLTHKNHEKVQESDAAIIMKYVRRHTNLQVPDRLGFGMKYSKKVGSLADAKVIAKIIIKLYQYSKKWDLQPQEQDYIRMSASSKLRSIFRFQRKHPTLLFYYLYSFFLFPGVIKIKYSQVNIV